MRIRLVLYSSVGEVDCRVVIPSTAATTVHNYSLIFALFSCAFRLIVVLTPPSPPRIHPSASRLIVVCFVLVRGACHGHNLPSEGDTSAPEVGRTLVCSLGGDGDCYGL